MASRCEVLFAKLGLDAEASQRNVHRIVGCLGVRVLQEEV